MYVLTCKNVSVTDLDKSYSSLGLCARIGHSFCDIEDLASKLIKRTAWCGCAMHALICGSNFLFATWHIPFLLQSFRVILTWV